MTSNTAMVWPIVKSTESGTYISDTVRPPKHNKLCTLNEDHNFLERIFILPADIDDGNIMH